jgi:hypothetical protein
MLGVVEQIHHLPEVNKMYRLAVLTIALILWPASNLVLAEQWFVIKDKAGVCDVWKTKAGTPTIIGGPYSTKDDARKALKAADCKEIKKKSEDK